MLKSVRREEHPHVGLTEFGQRTPDVLQVACDNARALVRICDVLEGGPARAAREPELHELPDGAFILPETV